MGVSDTRVGVSNTRMGVSNTRISVSSQKEDQGDDSNGNKGADK